MFRKFAATITLCLIMLPILLVSGCSERDKITSIEQLSAKEFAVPTGTAADILVLSKFPQAKFKYFNSVLDCALAVKAGKADAAAYDEPILKNIAGKAGGLVVLPTMITHDSYGFAVHLNQQQLKNNIDLVLNKIKNDGTYAKMITRWLPTSGDPAAMPTVQSTNTNGTLRLGTAAVTEPFSFIDDSQQVVGFDIELASYVAQQSGLTLEVVNMEFGALIPALISGKVDMIAACITITDERAKKVLFSQPYYAGGIAALVRK